MCDTWDDMLGGPTCTSPVSSLPELLLVRLEVERALVLCVKPLQRVCLYQECRGGCIGWALGYSACWHKQIAASEKVLCREGEYWSPPGKYTVVVRWTQRLRPAAALSSVAKRRLALSLNSAGMWLGFARPDIASLHTLRASKTQEPRKTIPEEALFIQLSSARGYLGIMSIERRLMSQFPLLFGECSYLAELLEAWNAHQYHPDHLRGARVTVAAGVRKNGMVDYLQRVTAFPGILRRLASPSPSSLLETTRRERVATEHGHDTDLSFYRWGPPSQAASEEVVKLPVPRLISVYTTWNRCELSSDHKLWDAYWANLLNTTRFAALADGLRSTVAHQYQCINPVKYSDAGWFTCQLHSGSYQNEERSDNCAVLFCNITRQDIMGRYARMVNAISDLSQSTEKPSLFLPDANPEGCDYGGRDMVRVGEEVFTTDDISPTWLCVASIIKWLESMRYITTRIRTYEESETHIIAWALMKSPVLIGGDVRITSLGGPSRRRRRSPFRWGINLEYINDTHPVQYCSGESQDGTVFVLAIINQIDIPDERATRFFNPTESHWIPAGRQYSVRGVVPLLLLQDAGDEPEA
ncbi:hypothetical protein EV401DRAFT_1894457 [Pisolithus croceorrhizus]|nr:hypothetical protein EV401DRAFT_1894457 [Pisolithus croceorrhizus]